MHLPDHFLDTPTTIATSAAAAAAVAMAVQRSRAELAVLAGGHDVAGGRSVVRDKVLLTAATTAVLFGLQMLNYPVASGTSGHLLGGALAAALLGPALAVVSVTTVVVVQALVFADGGLTAIGPNVLLMAVVAALVGWEVARRVHAATAGRASHAVVWSAAAGALAGVPVAAAAFAGLFAVGGTVAVPISELMSQMVGVHLLIGVGEAVITAGVVALVHALAPGSVTLTAVSSPVVRPAREAAGGRAAVALAGLATIAAVAVSPFAASAPDGLEATAQRFGLADAARDHALAGAPLADYGAGSEIFVGLAGLVGIALCAALTALVLRAIRAAVSPA